MKSSLLGVEPPALTMPQPIDILLTPRFLPEYGGSIRWLHEVYRRWPGPVRVVTHDYYNHPPRTPEFPDVPPRPATGDDVTDANLQMDRRDIFMRDWGVQSPGQLRRYARMTRAVGASFRQSPVVRVHCGHAVPEVVSLLPLKWRYGDRLKVICYAHGEEITACRSSRQLTFLMSRAHRVIDLMLANSRSTVDLLHGAIPSDRLAIVHPGVEVAEFAGAEQAGRQWRKEQKLEGRRIILTLGRLDPRKNHQAVIRALAGLSGAFADLVYVVAGEGRQAESLRSLAAELQVSDRVRFLGRVDGSTRLALFGGCDLFVMPAVQSGTDLEGFGIVFIEAAACGKPSVAGRVGGQAEAVRDGCTGLVVDGGNQEELVQALKRLLSDVELTGRLGRQARERAAELDWSRVVQRTVQLVENMQQSAEAERA